MLSDFKDHGRICPKAHVSLDRTCHYGFPYRIKTEFPLGHTGSVDFDPPVSGFVVAFLKVRVGKWENAFCQPDNAPEPALREEEQCLLR